MVMIITLIRIIIETHFVFCRFFYNLIIFTTIFYVFQIVTKVINIIMIITIFCMYITGHASAR